jgi:MinD superfamily P-loop ATPase
MSKAMKIAVLSGKGGTGKTFISVNLSVSALKSVYLDCDVEEPNGHLFLKPEDTKFESVYTLIPSFNEIKCDGCRKCVDFCHFNALAFIGQTPMVFSDVCHSCGGCSLICKNHAVSEIQREIGHIETGYQGSVQVISGVLNVGESSGIPVIKAVLLKASELKDVPVIIDCPPGSGCAVMESVKCADYCILVAEPTNFGFHNFEMVFELVKILGKRCGIIINKFDGKYDNYYNFSNKYGIEILGTIPYSREIVSFSSKAKVAAEYSNTLKKMFNDLLQKIEKRAKV